MSISYRDAWVIEKNHPGSYKVNVVGIGPRWIAADRETEEGIDQGKPFEVTYFSKGQTWIPRLKELA